MVESSILNSRMLSGQPSTRSLSPKVVHKVFMVQSRATYSILDLLLRNRLLLLSHHYSGIP